MKVMIIIAALAAVAAAAPRPEEYTVSAESVEAGDAVPTLRHDLVHEEGGRYSYTVSSESVETGDAVPILRDDRVHEEDGRYSVDVETGNGIVLSQSGSPDGPDGSVVMSGSYSYTAPDGTPVVFKFVADANGFQPESDLLPVAPAFPHPIPQFVLDQIAFAAEEDAHRARGDYSSEESVEAPAPTYSSPQ